MKVRITFWIAMVAMVAAMSVVVWHHSAPARKIVTALQVPPVISKVQNIAPASMPVVQPAVVRQTGPVLTATIALIVNSQADYRQRSDTIRALPDGKLTDADREALYAFLKEYSPQDSSQLGQVLKNQLLDALCAIQPPPQGLGELLEQIYQNPSLNEVLRDYAVQHLVPFYEEIAAAANADPQAAAELKQAQQTLWEAADETDDSISGTALLAMTHLLQAGFSEFDLNAIGDKAVTLAGQSDNELTRITALQVCASLNVTNALPFVMGAAQAGQTESVEISAIGALGSLGGPAQVPFLEQVLQGNDGRLRMPAQQALNSINQRLQQANNTVAKVN